MDIHEATTDDLAEELARRCPAGLIVLAVPDDGDTCHTITHNWGNRFCVLGMATMAVDGMKVKIQGTTEPE